MTRTLDLALAADIARVATLRGSFRLRSGQDRS